jgi:hypothetical protein
MTPLSAQLFTWYEHAPYMLDVGIAPLMGATVISLPAWKQIAAADQPIVLEEAAKAGARLRRDVPRLDEEAIVQMKVRGLTVTVGDRAAWRAAAGQFARTCANAWYQPMSTTVPAASAMPFAPRAQPGRALARLRRGEELLAGGVLAAMLALLLVEMTLRPWLGFAIPGSLQFVRVGTLWVALLGAALAAREGRLLALATASLAGARTLCVVLETAAASHRQRGGDVARRRRRAPRARRVALRRHHGGPADVDAAGGAARGVRGGRSRLVLGVRYASRPRGVAQGPRPASCLVFSQPHRRASSLADRRAVHRGGRRRRAALRCARRPRGLPVHGRRHAPVAV